MAHCCLKQWQIPTLLSWFLFWLGKVQFLYPPSPDPTHLVKLHMTFHFSYFYYSLWYNSNGNQTCSLLSWKTIAWLGTLGVSEKFWSKFHFMVFLLFLIRLTDACSHDIILSFWANSCFDLANFSFRASLNHPFCDITHALPLFLFLLLMLFGFIHNEGFGGFHP